MSLTQRQQLERMLKKRTLNGLMQLYESNFRLMERLIPDFNVLSDRIVSELEGSPPLYLQVLDRCKYTTTVSLTYFFQIPGEDPKTEPDLQVKVYHDARVIEAVACRRTGFKPLDERYHWQEPALECKWESNVFLDKWLSYALSQGHCFNQQSDKRIENTNSDSLEVS